MGRGFSEFFAALNSMLPPWAMGLIAAVLVIAAIPIWLHRTRMKQIGTRVRRMLRADDATKARLEDEIFELAAGKGKRLVALAFEARKVGQKGVADRAIRLLEETGQCPDDVAFLKKAETREQDKMLAHPLEVIVVVERLLEEGARVAAQERLEEALARYPRDAELLALRERVDPPG